MAEAIFTHPPPTSAPTTPDTRPFPRAGDGLGAFPQPLPAEDRRWRGTSQRYVTDRLRPLGLTEDVSRVRRQSEERVVTLASFLHAATSPQTLSPGETATAELSRSGAALASRLQLNGLPDPRAGGDPWSGPFLPETDSPHHWELIPPSLRGPLTRSLNDFAQVCAPDHCLQCPLKLLCPEGRAAQAREAGSLPLTMVDFFCGAGGLSEGFRQAGFRSVLAVDADEQAMTTYRLNHPELPRHAALCHDVRDFRAEAEQIRALVGGEVDVLVGGPPCQGFSRAGLRAKSSIGAAQGEDDDRNHLYRDLVALLSVIRPRAMVMENVPGIGEVRAGEGSFLDAVRAAMHDQGYQTASWVLSAAAYDAPQDRVRRFIVAVRDGPAPQQPPVATRHAPHPITRHDSLVPGPPPVTLGEALEGLPDLPGAGSGSNVSPWRDPNTGALSVITGHYARFNNPGDLARFAEILPGESYRSLVARRPDLRSYDDAVFADKFYKLPADRPSRTIVAHLQRDGNGYIHPNGTRSITPREAARLQTFPDDYLFTGPMTKVYRQIGNAVPPVLARAVAGHLREWLSAGRLPEEIQAGEAQTDAAD